MMLLLILARATTTQILEHSMKIKTLLSAFTAAALSMASAQSFAVTDNDTSKIHFLIPGGPGGGWDGTARGTGDALLKAKLIDHASFQNMSGGGGGKAIAYMIETSAKQKNTLMVNSTPIVIRSLTGVFPQSFRDLKPVAGTIADFGAFVVRADSKYTNWQGVVADFKSNPRKVKFAGGSTRGSTDHLAAALAIKVAGGNPKRLSYIAYDAGGKAMAGLLSGETALLSTGLSEAITMADSGEVRILAITSGKRVSAAPNVPTLKEMGYDVEFANWRGFFAAPSMPESKVKAYAKLLGDLGQTPAWKDVRDRNGWVDLYNPDTEFYNFLEKQEIVLGELMRELGFLK